MLYDDDPPESPGAVDDDRLRLIFTCCHPALAMEVRVALTLRMVGGLTMPEIARAFLVQEAAMGQRITRAKAKIKAARIPYRVPSAEDLPARVSGVLAVLFLVFNEGYLATGPDTDPVRHDLTAEAIRLTRLIRALMPEDGEVAGLLALMLLTEARRTARVSASGELVPSTSRTVGPGTRHWSPRVIGWCASAWRPGWLRVATRSSQRSAPCTPPPATYATPTGRRSSPSTTSSSASTPRRSSLSTGPSRSPSLTARRWHWRPSTVLRTSWPAITPTMRPAPTCCAGWAAVRSRARVRQSHRAGGQHRRDRLPDTPPRPAGVVLSRSAIRPEQHRRLRESSGMSLDGVPPSTLVSVCSRRPGLSSRLKPPMAKRSAQISGGASPAEGGSYETRPLDASTWDAFAELVERNNGVYGGCWCIVHHSEYQRGVSDPRTLKEELVRRAARMPHWSSTRTTSHRAGASTAVRRNSGSSTSVST